MDLAVVDPVLLGLALVAGAVAAFNPCGFALLPAYLTLLVATPPTPEEGTQSAAIGRAARFTTGMTVGFVLVFGIFGVLLTTLTVSLERYLPVVTIVVGLALVGLGVWLLTGRSLGIGGLARYGRAPRASWGSQVGYGATFALASLSCTIAPFLAVTAGAVRDGGPVGVVATYVVYALGMGAVVGVLALAAATASTGLVARMRRAAPVISRLSGALLVLAGAYVAWYGWFELRVFAGDATSDPVVGAAVEVQSAITRAVASVGVVTIVVTAVLVALVTVGAIVVRRRRTA
ncbi:cytochrome c biogenesis protein CcdA [Sediminihabitans luteus]|uniref:Cytochrome c biogenesis protein CcdA n=1 Tax=Sediminihabitans luteus TaxID=1138585 RepID=A0A2M9CZ08_9CELL|nr:cytochrome c biogenesis protein CcdA [Sediminihabitans luteus]PJJ77083.1 cytochrome c biogenesis protein CcdA [Sediminihabitans luteus]GIJ00398.1 integral membrane protein [Sediminihabitans luteus]